MMDRSPDEAEAWAEELLNLHDMETQQANQKLEGLLKQIKKGNEQQDLFPDQIGPKFPHELFSKLPPANL